MPERILPASTAPGDAHPPAPLQVLLGKWEQLIAPGKGRERECERTWDAGGHPWVPPAVERAPRRGAGAQGREAGVTLQRGRAAIGEVLCRSQLPVCNVRDGTLSLWGSPKKRGFSGVSLHNPTKVTKSHGSSV